MDYAGLIDELFPRLSGGIHWGLERTERILATVGNPHRDFHSLHIGGTNGKGSVSATLASILSMAGHRVGLYTSPHLCSFRERIQIDGVPVSETALVAAARRIWPVVQREEASFFEATTALAFLIFAESGVDIAVVEVGLGGRLDATNVIVPEVTVLTNVEIDHVDYLGGTRSTIAAEKAGIMKPGVPVVTGERDPALVEFFRRSAEAVAAPFHQFDGAGLRDLSVAADGTRFRLYTETWGELALHTPLIGAHQSWNAGLALRSLELLPPKLRPERDAVARGVAEVRWPGRLQWEWVESRSWLFDVAHNPAGIAALGEALSVLPVPRPLVAVVGIMGDKDWGEMVPPLLGIVDRIVLTTAPSTPTSRRWDPDQVLATLPEDRALVVPDFGEALEKARQLAALGTVLVTGSFHTVGDALAVLNLAPFGTDPVLPVTVADG